MTTVRTAGLSVRSSPVHQVPPAGLEYQAASVHRENRGGIGRGRHVLL